MPHPRSAPDVDVVVVLVAHDGARWLPRTLAALQAQSVRPAAVLAADTGSADASGALLGAAGIEVTDLPRATGYPAAVHAVLRRAPASRWLWLLHDDSAPSAGALAALLAHAAADPSAVLLGAKAVDWDDPRVLVEVGVTVDAGGTRRTGLERGEHDQGQHDAVRPVLAVGTAGALVRRDVWDDVGGLDPALPLLRDDVDLGWTVNAAGGRVVVVPAAVVAHARAAVTGRRDCGALQGRSVAVVDRRHALFVRLAHARAALLPLLLLAVVGAGLVRSLGLLLGRRPVAAKDEVLALGALLLRPDALVRARAERARTRSVPPAVLAPLFASRRDRAGAASQALGDWVAGGRRATSVAAADLAPDNGDPDGDELPPPAEPVLRRPGVLLPLCLLVVALLAERSLLPGTGPGLAGGRLLPAPASAAALWSSWADGGPPVLGLLAVLATATLGSARAAVDVIVLLGVPLAGLSAYLVGARLTRSVALRCWGAATWALLPVATGAVAAGRLDGLLAQVLLPPLLLLGVGVIGSDPRRDGWRRSWRAGLLLTVVAAGTPVLWALLVVLALLAVLGAGAVRGAPPAGGTRRRLLAVGVVAGVPLAILLPGWPALLTSPAVLLHGPWPTSAGLAGPVRGGLALLVPGGPGLPPAWLTAPLLTAPLLLAALGGPLRRQARRTAVLGWLAALGSLLAAGLLVRLTAGGARGWPGPALQVAGAGVLVAAVVAGDGLRRRLRRSAFGPRQVVAVAVAALAAVTPVLLASTWVVRGVDGPLRRTADPALPAFAVAELAASPGLRALVLQERSDGRLGYALVRGRGAQLGDRSAPDPALAGVVADLAAPRLSTAADALATRAVRYVALRPGGPDLAAALDAQPGLTRRAALPVPLWEVTAPAARLQVLSPGAATAARTAAASLTPELRRAAPPVAVARTVPPGPAGRLLVLAEPDGDGWHATLGGRPLAGVRAFGWAQGFVLPAGGGSLEVSRGSAGRRSLLALQVLALVVALVLAAPAARAGRGPGLAA